MWKTALDNPVKVTSLTMNTILKNVYVDNMLKSVNTQEKVIRIVGERITLLKSCGFTLTKWSSNYPDVFSRIIEECFSPGLRD